MPCLFGAHWECNGNPPSNQPLHLMSTTPHPWDRSSLKWYRGYVPRNRGRIGCSWFSIYSFISFSELLNRQIFLCYITIHKCLWMLQGIFYGRPDHESLSRQWSKGELNKTVGGLMQTFSKTWACSSLCEPSGVFALCLRHGVWQCKAKMGLSNVSPVPAASADGDSRTVANGPGSSAKSQPWAPHLARRSHGTVTAQSRHGREVWPRSVRLSC